MDDEKSAVDQPSAQKGGIERVNAPFSIHERTANGVGRPTFGAVKGFGGDGPTDEVVQRNG